MKRLLAFVSIAAALSLAACGRGPDIIATEFATAAYSGKTAEAMERLDPSVVQMGGPKLMAMMAQAGKKAATDGGLLSVRALETKVDGDYATVQIEKTLRNGSKKIESMKMRKVDGKWYVTM